MKQLSQLAAGGCRECNGWRGLVGIERVVAWPPPPSADSVCSSARLCAVASAEGSEINFKRCKLHSQCPTTATGGDGGGGWPTQQKPTQELTRSLAAWRAVSGWLTTGCWPSRHKIWPGDAGESAARNQRARQRTLALAMGKRRTSKGKGKPVGEVAAGRHSSGWLSQILKVSSGRGVAYNFTTSQRRSSAQRTGSSSCVAPPAARRQQQPNWSRSAPSPALRFGETRGRAASDCREWQLDDDERCCSPWPEPPSGRRPSPSNAEHGQVHTRDSERRPNDEAEQRAGGLNSRPISILVLVPPPPASRKSEQSPRRCRGKAAAESDSRLVSHRAAGRQPAARAVARERAAESKSQIRGLVLGPARDGLESRSVASAAPVRNRSRRRIAPLAAVSLARRWSQRRDRRRRRSADFLLRWARETFGRRDWDSKLLLASAARQSESELARR